MCMDGQESGEEKEGRYMVINGAANVTEELAEINKASKQAHAVKAPAPIYLQTDHLSAHTTDHCPDPAYRMPLWLEATDTIPIHTPQTEGHPT